MITKKILLILAAFNFQNFLNSKGTDPLDKAANFFDAKIQAVNKITEAEMAVFKASVATLAAILETNKTNLGTLETQIGTEDTNLDKQFKTEDARIAAEVERNNDDAKDHGKAHLAWEGRVEAERKYNEDRVAHKKDWLAWREKYNVWQQKDFEKNMLERRITDLHEMIRDFEPVVDEFNLGLVDIGEQQHRAAAVEKEEKIMFGKIKQLAAHAEACRVVMRANAKELAEFNAKQAAAKAAHDRELAQYEVDKKAAEQKFNQEKAAKLARLRKKLVAEQAGHEKIVQETRMVPNPAYQQPQEQQGRAQGHQPAGHAQGHGANAARELREFKKSDNQPAVQPLFEDDKRVPVSRNLQSKNRSEVQQLFSDDRAPVRRPIENVRSRQEVIPLFEDNERRPRGANIEPKKKISGYTAVVKAKTI